MADETQSRKLCEIHGLWYDPRLRSGCVVCRRPPIEIETVPEHVASPAPALLALALSMVVFGYVLTGGSVLRPLGLRGLGPDASEARPRSDTQAPRTDTVKPKAVVESKGETIDRCAGQALGGFALVGASERPTKGIHGAAAQGDVARLLQEIGLLTPKDQQDEHGRTPLTWAILAGQQEAALVLIRERASPSLATFDQETPLMLAATSGAPTVLEALLKAGARPNEVNTQQQTALMLAASFGRAAAIRVIAPSSTTLMQPCDRGMTALHYAAQGTDCTGAAEALLDLGAPINVRDQQGATPLLLALGEGHDEIARALLQRHADLTLRDYRGLGAIDYVVLPRDAMDSEKSERLRRSLVLLIERGADRRLGLDPRTTQILFRAELNALALREGRPRLPDHEAPQAARGPAAITEPMAASRLLFRQVTPVRSAVLPTWLYADTLLARRGSTRVPNIVRRVVLRYVAPRAGQRLGFAGSADGRAPWIIDDALLIESMRGSQRADAAFIGRIDQIALSGTLLRKLGRSSSRYTTADHDLTEILGTDHGADRVVLSALDFGGGFSTGELWLNVTGKGAAATAQKVTIEVISPPAGPR